MSDTRPDPEPRRCYLILLDQRDDEGYIPSVVVAGEPGHNPLVGNGDHARPWHWGRTYDEAKTLCAKFNADDFGHTPVDVAIIVASSMTAGPVPVSENA